MADLDSETDLDKSDEDQTALWTNDDIIMLESTLNEGPLSSVPS